MELWQLSAAQASNLMAEGRLTSEAYTRALLARIEARNPVTHAWVHVDPAIALTQARERDREPRRSRLHGIPVGIKDVIAARLMPTQYNSPIYVGHQTAEDANSVAVLLAAGAVLLGKTETLEFACGGRVPPTRNPHDTARTPGGSSSGSGAAVADGTAPITLGTQTGGSTIRPASFCGVYGMKPTFGRISFEGAKHYSVHLDTIGFFGRSAEDLWMVAQAFRMASGDAPAMPAIKGLRLGLCETPSWGTASDDAKAALHEAARRLAAAGAIVTPLRLPEPFNWLTEQQDVIMNEGGRGAFIPEYMNHPDLLHDDFKAKVENRRGFTAAQMRDVLDQVALRRIDFERAMGDLDAVLTLSAPGEATMGIQSQGEASFNRMFTALHVPCISVPGMKGASGLPIGIQLIQRRYEDEKLLAVAAAVASVIDSA